MAQPARPPRWTLPADGGVMLVICARVCWRDAQACAQTPLCSGLNSFLILYSLNYLLTLSARPAIGTLCIWILENWSFSAAGSKKHELQLIFFFMYLFCFKLGPRLFWSSFSFLFVVFLEIMNFNKTKGIFKVILVEYSMSDFFQPNVTAVAKTWDAQVFCQKKKKDKTLELVCSFLGNADLAKSAEIWSVMAALVLPLQNVCVPASNAEGLYAGSYPPLRE